MSSERLIYIPLGGAGEVGMNAYVYGYGPPGKERLILVDLGLTFPDMDTTPGVGLIMPDIDWLVKRVDRLEAIFITHAHEDHVGALSLLWDRLRVPVHARNFTARIARMKMQEHGHAPEEVQTAPAYPRRVAAGPFSVGFVPVSHSLPEASALVIDTPAGLILHSGDFKLDAHPVVGEPWDPAAFEEIARANVKVLACDSTNVFSPQPGRSESSLAPALGELIQQAPGAVAATTFASNVARLKTLAEAGRTSGRSICLLGRAMQRMVKTAEEAGLLPDFPPTITPEEAAQLPREKLMLIVTGSQGERRAASAQLAQGKYMGLRLKSGDMFLFSSKTIPGNERGVLRIMNQFSEMEVDVVDAEDGKYHVSGHANRPDLETIHNLIKPQMTLPMHGEHRHLREHARIATESGVASLVAPNGSVVDLTGDTPQIVDEVPAGRTYLDGSVLIGARDGVVRDRIRMALNGLVVVSLLIEEDGTLLGEPWAEAMGLPEAGRSGGLLIDRMEVELNGFCETAGRKVLIDDDKLEDGLRRVARQVAMEEIGRKPELRVIISRMEAG